ncbi:MAG: crossover junction endodeoxyribonuclease RuvC [Steroidobacteraceae bacterium]|jgi:crossover junction endodeoxyribonuclease RuvC|nr:crossover junction endodeoxyribonuclease RuvC [Steroidobacteraceae bacterium]
MLRLATVPSLPAAPAPAPREKGGSPVRVLGLDPGSRVTGYGLIEVSGRGTRYLASGSIRAGTGELAGRLRHVFSHVSDLVAEHAPDEIAIERVFMHANPDSALKLGQARGAALCAAVGGGAAAFEYTPREVKLTVTGTGAADKDQVQHMVKALLGLTGRLGADASDALAIALCHAQHRGLALLVRAR